MTESTPSADEVFSAAALASLQELKVSAAAIGRLSHLCEIVRRVPDSARERERPVVASNATQKVLAASKDLLAALNDVGAEAWLNLWREHEKGAGSNFIRELQSLIAAAERFEKELAPGRKQTRANRVRFQVSIVRQIASELHGEGIEAVGTAPASRDATPFSRICDLCFDAVGLKVSSELAIKHYRAGNWNGTRKRSCAPANTPPKPVSRQNALDAAWHSKGTSSTDES